MADWIEGYCEGTDRSAAITMELNANRKTTTIPAVLVLAPILCPPYITKTLKAIAMYQKRSVNARKIPLLVQRVFIILSVVI